MRTSQPSIETRAPFRRSPEQTSARAGTIRGSVPEWLRGEVVRTCPAVFETEGWRAEHWFDGLGMIYAFRIGAQAVDFQSRLLASESGRDAARGEANLASFGTPTSRSWLRRVVEPVPRVSDNTNVNIVRMGPELVAMTEGDRQQIIDRETLAATGVVAYAKETLAGAIMTAHPQRDVPRHKVVNVGTEIGMHGVVSVYEHDPAARRREIIGSWRTSRVPYVHTFGLTPKHAILVAHPFAVTPVSMLWSSKGYIDHFQWHPEQGTRLVVIERASGALREHLTDAFFVFHTVNAFERDDETVLDVLAYPDADIVAALRVDRMIAQLPDLRPALRRIVLRPGVERAEIETLSDVGFEFPSIHHARVGGMPYRFVYGASDGPRPDGKYGSVVVKTDITTGRVESFQEGSYIFGEPLFVARPGGVDEDDGVLLTVGAAADADASVLAVLDARTMALVARVDVESAIPLGFHGSFVPKEG